jgi:hypothetical protein
MSISAGFSRHAETVCSIARWETPPSAELQEPPSRDKEYIEDDE